MTIKKLTPETYKNYFEDLAEKNKAIAYHAENNPQFFCVDMDEVEEGIFNYQGADISKWTMVLEEMTGRIGGDDSDHLNVITHGAFLIVKQCDKGDRVAERTIMDEAFIIGKQFLAKMRKDQKSYNAVTNDNVMSQFKATSITYQKMKAVFDNAFGYRFEFETGKGEILKHDDGDWNA